MKLARFISFILIVFTTAFISSCFEAERDNPYDLKSPNNPYYGHPIYMDRLEINFGTVALGEDATSEEIAVYKKDSNSIYIWGIEFNNINDCYLENVSWTSPGYLEDNESIHFRVRFNPTYEGEYNGSVDVIYNDEYGPRISMPVKGYGGTGSTSSNVLAASGPGGASVPYTFDTIPPNAQIVQTFTLKNTSGNTSDVINLSDINIGANVDGAYSTLSGTTTFSNNTLAYGESATFELRFAPTHTGNFNNVGININYNVNGGTQQTTMFVVNGYSEYDYYSDVLVLPSSVDFGDAKTGNTTSERTITIFNNSSSYDISAITVTPTGTGEFDYTFPVMSSLSPKGFTTFTIKFHPTYDGSQNTNFQISYYMNGYQYYVNMSAEGTGVSGSTTGGQLTVSPDTTSTTPYDFGSVDTGTSTDYNFSLYNYSTQGISISSVNEDQDPNGAFSVISAPSAGTYLQASTGYASFTVQFQPSTVMTNYTGSVRIQYTINSQIYEKYVYFRGDGTSGGTFHFTELSYDFLDMPINVNSETYAFTLQNDMSTPVTISNWQLSNSTDFYFSTYPSTTVSGYGGTTTFSVYFSPQSTGNLSSTITITSSYGLITAELYGEGTHRLYVRTSTNGGNDSYQGSMARPKASIQGAVNVAYEGYTIYVEQGDYTVLNGMTLSGVELKGGYMSGASWSESYRDPDYYKSTITNTGSNTDKFVFQIDGNYYNYTIIDGFEIFPGSAYNTAGIRINTDVSTSHSSIIRNNIIHGGTASSGNSNGIYLNDNSGLGYTYNVEISANDIFGGTAGPSAISFSNGIYLNRSTMTDVINVNIWNNVIDGGSASSPTDARSIGIFCSYFSPKIYNNTIDGGEGSGAINASYGIYLGGTTNSNPDIRNNIIFTSLGMERYGIYEFATGNDPTYVDNNDIFDCPTALYYDDDIQVMYGGNYGYLDTVTITAPIGTFTRSGGYPLSSPTGSANITIAPVFVSSTDLHLSSTSNTVIQYGGIVLPDFTTDKDGNTRSGTITGWSMGAYEY